MAPSKKYDAIAVRVVHSEHLDWKTLFPDALFCVSVMELSKKGVVHSHTGLILAKTTSRTTIMSRIQKHYPTLVGNGNISCKAWDGRDEYLDYIHKTVIYDVESLGEHDVGSYKRFGTRINAFSAQEHKERFFANSKKRKDGKTNAVDWCIEQLKDVSPEYHTPYVIVTQLYKFYSDQCEGNVNGNTWQVVATARKILFKLRHTDSEFKQRWITTIQDLM